jgi:hypothetical protein
MGVMHKLLQIWPSITALSDALGVPYPTVASWKVRGIPGHRYLAIIRAARALGHDLTVEDLAHPNTPDQSDEAAA